MRNILRLSLTLALVGIVSALLLTGLFNLTEPIITERQEREYLETLEAFFPDIDTFETEVLEADAYDMVYDVSGQLLGVMGTIKQQGYDGDITYNLAINQSGEVVGIRIVSHSETPGIGDVIETEAFQEQFKGKSYEDPIAAGEDVDSVSGATVSSSAMINSIRRVVGVVAENYLGIEAVTVEISEVPDGVYEGSAPGLMGLIVVEVEVSGGAITRIEVLEHEDTPTYFIEAYPLIAERIIEAQDFDIDIRTGATVSSEGILNAVINALLGALGIDSGDVEEVEDEPVAVDFSEVPDGVYEGTAEGFLSPIVVEVEVSGGEVISISIINHEETAEYFVQSNPLVPERIIEEQTLDVDIITGATNSARGIVNAVRNALIGALQDGTGGDGN
ncbi:MAG: FMN-binding protein [Bacillota bacterium]|nr:FMN-binding protein [Bacillota bacterium]